jgi:syntaxin-binding protein 5
VPLVSLTERKDGTEHGTPPAPAPVSLGPADWRTWLGGLVGSGSITGDQMHALCVCSPEVAAVAGPDRPVPGYSVWEAGPSKARATVASTERAKSNLYDRLHAAVSEFLVLSLRMPTLYIYIYMYTFREMLGHLETSVNSLEQGRKNMLAQAKLLAAKQPAKGWMPKY